MKKIQETLNPIMEYIFSIEMDLENQWFIAKIGIPKNWEIKGNKDIDFEVEKESDIGRVIKLTPKRKEVVIDDLILFIKIVVDTNIKIAEKEKEFTNEMNEMKKQLQSKIESFYSGLDQYKDEAFKKLTYELENKFKTSDDLEDEEEKENVIKKPRKREEKKEPKEKTTTTQVKEKKNDEE